MNSKWFLSVLCSGLFVSSALAQDMLEDFPEDPPVDSLTSATSAPATNSAPTPQPTTTPPDALSSGEPPVADSDLSGLESDLDPTSTPTPTQQNAQAAPPPAANDDSLDAELNQADSSMAVGNPEDAQPPEDLKALDQLDKAAGVEAQEELMADKPPAPLEASPPVAAAAAPAPINNDELLPPDLFARIPLRPAMSDANWNKWAGPVASKNYRVRKGDSFWAISERLFGTPHLWPKVWQLNAKAGNPHIIEPKTDLSFRPGNPNSAPELAIVSDPAELDNLPLPSLDKNSHHLSMLELVDETLREQIAAPHPPFQYFMMEKEPRSLAKIPVGSREGRALYLAGDQFSLKLPDGIYPVIRSNSYNKGLFHSSRVRWLGEVRIKRNEATIVRAFSEIMPGDSIILKRFELSPLAIHPDVVGPLDRLSTSLLPLQEGGDFLAGPGMLMGIRFPDAATGPRPGALLTIKQDEQKQGLALLVDRDRSVGTLWLLESQKEVSPDNEIQ